MKPAVFSCRLDTELEKNVRSVLLSLCSDETVERSRRCKDKASGDMLLVSEALSRIAIKKCFGIDMKEQKFCRTENGKPYLEGRDDIFFNRSHSGNICVCAVYDGEIGIDIQKHEKKKYSIDKIADRFFIPDEYFYLKSLSDEKRELAFFDLWAKKESFVKYTGKGIAGLSEHADSERKFIRLNLFDGYSAYICI